MGSAIRFARRGGCVAWVVACLSGCAIGEKTNGTQDFAELLDLSTAANRAEFEEEINELLEYAENEVDSAADQIEAETEVPAVARAALQWKVGVYSFEHQLRQSDQTPVGEFFETWAFCLRHKIYFSTGSGAQLFQDHQHLATTATDRIYTRFEQIARERVPEDKYQELSRFVDTYARANPIRPVFSYEVQESLKEEAEREGLIAKVFGKPLAALGKASKDALDPTTRLATSVDDFNALMADYPEMVRWQTQLLWLQLQDSKSMRTTVAGVEDVSKSSVRLATVAEELPQRVREEVQIAFSDVMDQQEDLQTTVREVRDTLDATTAALKHADRVSASIERSLVQVTRAGEVWEVTAGAVTETVKQIQEFKPKPKDPAAADNDASSPDAAEKRRKFDINDYTQTAEALTVSTQELRGLFTEVRAFLDGETLAQDLEHVNALTTSTAGEARALVDHIAWRGVQLCGLIFVLALVYRFVAGRRARSLAA